MFGKQIGGRRVVHQCMVQCKWGWGSGHVVRQIPYQVRYRHCAIGNRAMMHDKLPTIIINLDGLLKVKYIYVESIGIKGRGISCIVTNQTCLTILV